MNRRLSNKTTAYYLILIVLIALQSCRSTKTVPYFSDISLGGQSSLSNSAKFTEPIIQSDDILSISIFTIDPTTSMIVNQVGSQAISVAAGEAGGLSATPATSGFLVDKKGEIDLALVGKVKVSGLTTFEAKELISEKAINSYKNANVQVRFANFKITVLGEVLKPSTYTLPNEKVSILDALGLAGDMTIYGRRENVLLIREVNGIKEFARLNLNSKELFTSPYYYLKQNDVLYVEPDKGKAASLNTARTQTIAIVGTALTVLIALISRL